MPIQVTCPSCSSSFKAPDSAGGKKAKCPKCSGVIDIPASFAASIPVDEVYEAEEVSAPASEADEYEVESPQLPASPEARQPCPMCGEMISSKAVKCRFCGEVLDHSMVGLVGGSADMRDPRWQTVRNGLGLVYYSVITILLVVILVMIGAGIMGAMAQGQRPDSPPVVFTVGFVLAVITILCAGLASIVGYIMCAFVPEASGAKNYIMGSLLCSAINFAIGFVSGALDIQALGLLSSLFSIGSWVMFILFIRYTAAFLGNVDLASSANKFLIFAIAMFVVGFFVGVALAVAQAPALLGILGLAAIIGGLVAFVWYLRLIQNLKTTIEERTRTA